MRLLLLLSCLGCSSETTLRLTVKPGSTQPKSLRLILWGEGLLRPPADLPLGSHTLPGTLLVRHLDAKTPDFRLLVQGLDERGVVGSENGVRVALAADQESSATVQLADGRLPDSDGDGIPDAIDDCPQVADSDQRCAGAPPDLAGLPDLGAADLADLADLATSPSADLAGNAACPPFAIFCDDFESGDFKKWGALHDEGGTSSFTVDGTQKFAGSFAAHAVGSGGLIWAPHLLSPAITSGMIAFRAYFYTPTTLVPHLYFFYLHRAGASSDYNLGWDNFLGPDQWTLFNKNPGNDKAFNASGAPGVWHCLEMDVSFVPGGGNKVELYFDTAGAQVWDVPAAEAAPSLDEFDIGVTYQNVSTGNEWYFDDVAVATQHIGCE